MDKRRIQIGDSFRRRGNPTTDWVVERLFEYKDIPPHARLIERGSRRVITLAMSVLRDERQFVFVASAADQEPH